MKLLAMKRTTRSQLRKGDQPWEGRLWESHQAMNKKSIRGRRGEMSWHNTAKSLHSISEVNGTLGWRRIKCLPGEISLAMRCVKTQSVHRGDTEDDQREVSRSHSSDEVATVSGSEHLNL